MNETPSRRRRAFGLSRGAAAVAVLLLGLFALAPGTARAAVPANDDFANATIVDQSSLPFNDSVDITDATLESGEPTGCYFGGKSIWYSITPTSDAVLRADIGGSSFFDRILYVYRADGAGFGGLSTIACASPYYNGASAATFNVQAGKTYYIQVGGFLSYSAGTLALSLDLVPPPPNDDFANAKPITALPYSDSIDTTAATKEAGEPFPCGSTGGTAWYSYTASDSGSVTASGSAPFSVQLAAYTGSSLGNLSSAGCQYGRLTIHVDAGKTYFFQVGGVFSGGGPVTLQLDRTPNPVMGMYLSPPDPSTFDTVQFYDQSYDPAGLGFSSESWSFGDGGAATGCCPTHRYAADGNYTAKLLVTTPDGRTGTLSQLIHVRTHDVAISKLTVPQSALAGQTRSITVGITDTRYPETVEVQLFRNDTLVGTLRQDVPVRGPNRTTAFGFTYTFTSADAALGKVTFKAVATIVGARDALPSDNTAIALPTKVG